jgi:hypothetical protein
MSGAPKADERFAKEYPDLAPTKSFAEDDAPKN